VLCEAHLDELVRTAREALFVSAGAYAPELAMDVVDDIVTQRLHRLPQTEKQIVAFAKGVIRNRAKHINRDHGRHVPLESAVSLQADSTDPWKRAEAVTRARDIIEAFAHLTPRQREVAVLHWQEQWTTPEIADALGVSIKTVKELLRRARRRLRDMVSCPKPRVRANGSSTLTEVP
jgi:RNA polymerase sigma factor (sigma-70 family)